MSGCEHVITTCTHKRKQHFGHAHPLATQVLQSNCWASVSEESNAGHSVAEGSKGCYLVSPVTDCSHVQHCQQVSNGTVGIPSYEPFCLPVVRPCSSA